MSRYIYTMISSYKVYIGDIHGSMTKFEAMLRHPAVERVVQRRMPGSIILTGDYMDRGHWGIEVFQKVKELTEKGVAVPLAGNHDRMFINAMYYRQAETRWRQLGGSSFISEAQNKFKSYGRIYECNSLWDIANWMKQNLSLYNIDENGVFSMHAELPVKRNGTIDLERQYPQYRGMVALDVLKTIEASMLHYPNAEEGYDPGFDKIFWETNQYRFLGETAIDILLGQLGASAIVCGHTPNWPGAHIKLSQRTFGKINMIDYSMIFGAGGFLVFDPMKGISAYTFIRDSDREFEETRITLS